MKRNFILLCWFLCLFVGITFAQESRLKYVGVEGGSIDIVSNVSNVNYIRGSVAPYSNGYSTNDLACISSRNFYGVKGTIFSQNDRFALLTGLRYSRIISSVSRNSNFSNTPNYFYWLYKQDGVNTEYLKVNEINQKSDYIGVPIEVIYFPGHRPHLFRIYFKIGVEENLLIQTNKDVVFQNPAMNQYESNLKSQVDQPKTFYSSAYGGCGIRIGRDQKPNISYEFCLPYLFLTPQSKGLVNPTSGIGFQINFQIPIK